MMLKLFIILNSFVFLTNAKLYPIRENLDQEVLSKATVYALDQYISRETNTVVLMRSCVDCHPPDRDAHERFLDYLLKNVNNLAVEMFMQVTVEYPWKYFLFLVDSAVSFKSIVKSLPAHDFEIYLLIVLSNDKLDGMDLTFELRIIFQACIAQKIFNIVVLFPESFLKIEFYSYKLYGHNCSSHIRIYSANCFFNDTLLHDFVYPEDTLNLNGCTLNVCSVIYPPFMMFDGDIHNKTHLNQLERFTGIKAEFVKEMARTFSFHINLTIINSYSTECWNMLDEKSSDISIIRHYYQQLDIYSSTSSFKQPKLIMVLRSPRHRVNIFSPFETSIWTLLTVAFFSLFLVLRQIQKRRSTRGLKALTDVTTALLGNPINRLSKRKLVQYLMLTWLLITLVLRVAYLGKLFGEFRRTPDTLPKNISDAITKKYILISNIYTPLYPMELTRIVPGNVFDVVNDGKREHLIAAVFAPEFYYAYFKNRKFKDLTQIPGIENGYYRTIFFRKHSSFLRPMERKLLLLSSAGLIHYWYLKYSADEWIVHNLYEDIEPQAAISFDILSHFLAYVGIFLSVALVIFLLELLSLKLKWIKKICDWIHNIET